MVIVHSLKPEKARRRRLKEQSIRCRSKKVPVLNLTPNSPFATTACSPSSAPMTSIVESCRIVLFMLLLRVVSRVFVTISVVIHRWCWRRPRRIDNKILALIIFLSESTRKSRSWTNPRQKLLGKVLSPDEV